METRVVGFVNMALKVTSLLLSCLVVYQQDAEDARTKFWFSVLRRGSVEIRDSLHHQR
jgi:hypothetical protein